MSSLAALAAQRSVEALKASSHRRLAARARAMSPMSGPTASGRARGKALLAMDNVARLDEEVSLAQALGSIPTPLTTPPRIQNLQYTTLTAHSPPPSFSPAKRGDSTTPSKLSLWLGETLQGVRPTEACCDALAAPAGGPQAAEDLSPVVTRRRLSGKRPAPLQETPLEKSRCVASTLGSQAATEPKTPMPRRRLSGKGPAHRNPTPVLLSQPCPAPSSQLYPSAEREGLQGSSLPGSQTVVVSEQVPSSIPVTNTGVQLQRQQEEEVITSEDLHSVSSASELTKSTSPSQVGAIMECTGRKRCNQEQLHRQIAGAIRHQKKPHDDEHKPQQQQRQQQRERGQDWFSSRRKDQGNKLRLSRRAANQRQMRKGALQIIDLDCSPVGCNKEKARPVKHAKQPAEQQYRHEAKQLPQQDPRLQQEARREGRTSTLLGADAAKRKLSHNCRMKRLKPLKLPVSCMGTRRRRTGHAEVSSVVGAVLACLHSAAPVPVVAVDIPLAEDID